MDTYTLHEHARMLGSTVRTSAYVDALRSVVKPGDTVLDIGTGVGTWAIAACHAGARRVYAVDPSAVIVVGQELAAANGFGDRIEFIRGSSVDLTIERVNVIVQEIHGVLPMCGSSLATIIDARRRLLVPGGVLVPRCETLWAALVDSPGLYAAHDRPWGESDHGFTFNRVREAMTNYWLKRPVSATAIVELPQIWAILDYSVLDRPHVQGTVTWPITRPATLHGVALWFDAVLADGVAFSNAPDLPGLPFGQAFLPFRQPVLVAEGDTVQVQLIARLLDSDYLWYWSISVFDRTGAKRAHFEQSDFWQEAISPQVVRRAQADYVALPNKERRVDLLVLDGLERSATLSDIAAELRARFPDRFREEAVAIDHVERLARAYGLDMAEGQR